MKTAAPESLRSVRLRLAAATVSLLCLSLSAPGASATGSSAAAHDKTAPGIDLSGFYRISDGYWTVPFTAKLTPKGIALQKKAAADMAAGKVVVYASRWCNQMGVPFIMGQSPPMDIVQGADEIMILTEWTASPRHIYLDGRAHPRPSEFEPITDGHSIGHWEGNELVVDTTNFSGHGIPGVPGGGFRTPTSHLIERFSLIDGGKTLVIKSTWVDPRIFAQPHSYTSVFHRLPADTYALEDACDASDAAAFTNSGGTSGGPDEDF